MDAAPAVRSAAGDVRGRRCRCPRGRTCGCGGSAANAVAGPRLALPLRQHPVPEDRRPRDELCQRQGRKGVGRGVSGPRRLRLARTGSATRLGDRRWLRLQGERLAGLSQTRRRLVPARAEAGCVRSRPPSRTAVRRHRHPRHGLVQRRAGEPQLVGLQLGLYRHHAVRAVRQPDQQHRSARRRRADGGLVVRRRWPVSPRLAGQTRSGAHRHRRRLRASTAWRRWRLGLAGRGDAGQHGRWRGDGRDRSDAVRSCRTRSRAGRHFGAGAGVGAGDGEVVAGGIRSAIVDTRGPEAVPRSPPPRVSVTSISTRNRASPSTALP